MQTSIYDFLDTVEMPNARDVFHTPDGEIIVLSLDKKLYYSGERLIICTERKTNLGKAYTPHVFRKNMEAGLFYRK